MSLAMPRPRRLLIVADEPAVARSLKRVLSDPRLEIEMAPFELLALEARLRVPDVILINAPGEPRGKARGLFRALLERFHSTRAASKHSIATILRSPSLAATDIIILVDPGAPPLPAGRYTRVEKPVSCKTLRMMALAAGDPEAPRSAPAGVSERDPEPWRLGSGD